LFVMASVSSGFNLAACTAALVGSAVSGQKRAPEKPKRYILTCCCFRHSFETYFDDVPAEMANSIEPNWFEMKTLRINGHSIFQLA